MREVILLFARLGVVGFGGPIAVIGMIEEEVCRKRNWLTLQRFSEMLAVCKVLPGPLATQMAIWTASEKKGKLGGLLGGIAFILPSFLLVLVLSYFYAQAATMSSSRGFMTGLQAGALAVILLSVNALWKPYKRSVQAWWIALLAMVLTFIFPRFEPIVIIFFGLIGIFLAKTHTPRTISAKKSSGLVGVWTIPLFAGANSPILAKLFWVCFKAGAFVFGTGLAIVPVLEAETVTHYGWLTHREFMDGLAIGQITPGPVVITSTFIGYKTAGFVGATVATVGIFIPAFFNILVIVPKIWRKLEGTPGAIGFAKWAIPAVVGAIFAATCKLGWIGLRDVNSIFIFIVALAAGIWGVVGIKIPSWLLILLSGGVGILLQFI